MEAEWQVELVPWVLYFNTTQDPLGQKRRGGREQVCLPGLQIATFLKSGDFLLLMISKKTHLRSPSTAFQLFQYCGKMYQSYGYMLSSFIFLHYIFVFLGLSHFLSSLCGLP